MTWNSFHRRGEILRAVSTAADERLDGALPLDVPGARESFTDEVDLVGALALRWHARLSGNLERSLAAQPMALEAAVVEAWRRTAQQLPGIRLVLDRAIQEPATSQMGEAMRRAQRSERVRLAQAAGLANDGSERAVRAGDRLEREARVLLAATPAADAPTARERSDRASFVRRIKAVLAA